MDKNLLSAIIVFFLGVLGELYLIKKVKTTWKEQRLKGQNFIYSIGILFGFILIFGSGYKLVSSLMM